MTPDTEQGDSPRWAVVGGGALGLSLAMRLAQKGIKVTLVEAAPTLGGLASPWTLIDDDNGPPIRWDRFYHVTLLSDLCLRGLLDELGLESQMRWVETKTGFFTGGKLHSMSNTLEFLKFPPLKFIEKLRLGGTIFYASKLKDWKKLERVPVGDWLKKHSGRGVFEKIWLPLLRAKLGETYRETSAAFIWAHINRMYSARRSGLKKEMFGYLPGGYENLLGRMAERLRELGVEIRTSSPVKQVLRDGDGLEVEFATGDRQRYSQVLFTTPSPGIAKVCPQLSADERRLFEGVKYLGVVCASVLLKSPISPYYVTNITDTWVPLTAVIEMTTIVDRDEFGGRSLVYLPKYVAAEDPLFEMTDEAFKEQCLSTLEKMYPHFSRDQVDAFRIARARQVMALPTIRYSEKLPPMRTSVPGIWGINSAHILKGNLNVNETIQVAEAAVEGVLAELIAETRQAMSAAGTDKSYEPTDRELVTRS
jgi:protoporphyrinogen oxidase